MPSRNLGNTISLPEIQTYNDMDIGLTEFGWLESSKVMDGIINQKGERGNTLYRAKELTARVKALL